MARKKQDSETVLESTQLDPEMTSEVNANETATEEKSSKKTRVTGDRKTGQELLDYAQANQGATGEELAFGAGYYTTTSDTETGETQTRVHKNEFFKSLTEASSGIVIPAARRAYTSRRNRAPIVTIGKNGNCVIGSRHSAVAGFAPGSRVQVTAEEGRIIVTPLDEASAAAADTEADDDMDL